MLPIKYLKKFEKKYPDFEFISIDEFKKYFMVRCKKCNRIFKKSIESFWKGYGCKFCANNQKLNFKKFLKKLPSSSKLKPVFNEEDWSLEYKNTKTKFNFKCVLCNHIFKTTPNCVLYNKSKCPKCASSKKAWRKMTFEQFLYKTSTMTNDQFLFNSKDWELNYKRSKSTKFNFKCFNNHIYKTTIDSYLNGSRCPFCIRSKGEEKIQNFLETYKIHFISEKIFDDCKSEKGFFFRFDFFLPSYNLIIEFDGKHHFEDISFFKSKCAEVYVRDLIKNNFCKKNKINIIRIPFWEINNIDFILRSILWQLEE